MKRVVVTGIGIWSCIGQDLNTVTDNLIKGKSGIIFDPQRINVGLQCGIVGNIPIPDIRQYLPRKNRATMSIDSTFAYMASKQAFHQALIDKTYISTNEIGILFGNDCNTSVVETAETLNKNQDSLFIGTSALFKNATSSITMNLSTIFKLKGINLTIGAACSSSSHAIGLSTILIRNGLQNIILTGGSCETEIYQNAPTDAIQALSLNNNNPMKASRPFDRDRDGMVPSGGAAALVLEEYEHAKARGANILAEVVGYGFSSNGIEDISAPSADAEYIAMKRALDDAGIKPEEVDYVNAHATSTIQGDIEEAKALTKLFGTKSKKQGAKTPWISSTKSMTGHENWMAGASEAVYSILMMQNNFVAPNLNLENVIDEAKGLRIARETIYTPVNTVLSNSSGMGGTNSALVFRKI